MTASKHQLIQLDTGEYFIISKLELRLLQLISDTPGITSRNLIDEIKLRGQTIHNALWRLKQNGVVSCKYLNGYVYLRYAPIHTFKCVDVQAYRGMRFVEGSDIIVKNMNGYFYLPGNTHLLFSYCVNYQTKMGNRFIAKRFGIHYVTVGKILFWLKKVKLLVLKDNDVWENDSFTTIPLNFLHTGKVSQCPCT